MQYGFFGRSGEKEPQRNAGVLEAETEKIVMNGERKLRLRLCLCFVGGMCRYRPSRC